VLIWDVLERLRGLGVDSVTEIDTEPETTTFRLPPELVRNAGALLDDQRH
jgi:hypothetical protein